MNNDYYALIKKVCAELKFDPCLMAAIVNRESNWSPSAVRYEANYKYLWQPEIYAKKNNITVDTETICQRLSYSLAQIIGGSARWLGYDDSLLHLMDPELSIKYGVLLFQRKCVQYPILKDQISAYNAGHPLKQKDGGYINQAYVDAVFDYYTDLKKQGI